jgi:hypothetical protein
VPAVTHVDGTARLQTVTAESNGLLYELLAAFERETGVPVLLNTASTWRATRSWKRRRRHRLLSKIGNGLVGSGPFVVEKRNPELARQLARKHRELMAAQKKWRRRKRSWKPFDKAAVGACSSP